MTDAELDAFAATDAYFLTGFSDRELDQFITDTASPDQTRRVVVTRKNQ